MSEAQRVDSDYVVSTELECLTVIDGERSTESSHDVLHAFLERMAALASPKTQQR